MNSIWLESVEKIKSSGKIEEDTSADVCIIGAGMCGITTAYYLTKKGYNVVVVEKNEIANGVTGHTTAKITSQHGLIYHYLSEKYGINVARKYFEANEEGIKNIKEIIRENGISCDFEDTNSYIYTTNESEIEKINEEMEYLKHVNKDAEKTNETDLPFKVVSAIKFKNQGQFNPLKYVQGLVNYILEHKGRIYTNTLCADVKKEDDGYLVLANENKIYAKYVVLCSQYPFLKVPGFYFAKMYQESSYVLGIKTKNKLPKDMYINLDAPVYSFRRAKYNGEDILLAGGAGHKTGQKVTYDETYGMLEKKAKELYPDARIVAKWSTRDAVTLDKIAYIGDYSSLMPNMYVATGFNKWGMTTSNVAANIIVDKITNNGSIYEEVFKATRFKPIENKDEMKNMLVDSTKSLLTNRIKESELEIDDIKENSGGVIERDGEKIGVYKNEDGKYFYVKPVCTHLGCILEWNDADKTWDCPCHGSRFDKYGKNLLGPAIKDLEKYEINKKEDN